MGEWRSGRAGRRAWRADGGRRWGDNAWRFGLRRKWRRRPLVGNEVCVARAAPVGQHLVAEGRSRTICGDAGDDERPTRNNHVALGDKIDQRSSTAVAVTTTRRSAGHDATQGEARCSKSPPRPHVVRDTHPCAHLRPGCHSMTAGPQRQALCGEAGESALRSPTTVMSRA